MPLARSHPEVLVDIILALQERLSALELEANDSDFVGDARLGIFVTMWNLLPGSHENTRLEWKMRLPKMKGTMPHPAGRWNKAGSWTFGAKNSSTFFRKKLDLAIE